MSNIDSFKFQRIRCTTKCIYSLSEIEIEGFCQWKSSISSLFAQLTWRLAKESIGAMKICRCHRRRLNILEILPLFSFNLLSLILKLLIVGLVCAVVVMRMFFDRRIVARLIGVCDVNIVAFVLDKVFQYLHLLAVLELVLSVMSALFVLSLLLEHFVLLDFFGIHNE